MRLFEIFWLKALSNTSTTEFPTLLYTSACEIPTLLYTWSPKKVLFSAANDPQIGPQISNDPEPLMILLENGEWYGFWFPGVFLIFLKFCFLVIYLFLSTKRKLYQIKEINSGAPYSYGNEKETHEWIFSWLSWLLLVGAYARRRRHGGATWRPNTNLVPRVSHLNAPGDKMRDPGNEVGQTPIPQALVYRVRLWYWISMLCSIDTCQFKVSADRYDVPIWRARMTCSCRVNLLKRRPGCP